MRLMRRFITAILLAAMALGGTSGCLTMLAYKTIKGVAATHREKKERQQYDQSQDQNAPDQNAPSDSGDEEQPPP